MDENMIKYCLKILIIGLLIFALTSIIMNTLGINLNIEEQPKKLIQVITMEAFEKQKDQDQKGDCKSCTYDQNQASMNVLGSKSFLHFVIDPIDPQGLECRSNRLRMLHLFDMRRSPNFGTLGMDIGLIRHIHIPPKLKPPQSRLIRRESST